jgi:hypothetical protein
VGVGEYEGDGVWRMRVNECERMEMDVLLVCKEWRKEQQKRKYLHAQGGMDVSGCNRSEEVGAWSGGDERKRSMVAGKYEGDKLY